MGNTVSAFFSACQFWHLRGCSAASEKQAHSSAFQFLTASPHSSKSWISFVLQLIQGQCQSLSGNGNVIDRCRCPQCACHLLVELSKWKVSQLSCHSARQWASIVELKSDHCRVCSLLTKPCIEFKTVQVLQREAPSVKLKKKETLHSDMFQPSRSETSEHLTVQTKH